MTVVDTRRRSRRMELRTTPAERELIDRAVEQSGEDLTEFVVSSALERALRLLADRDHFELDPAQAKAWDAINAEPARDLPSLRALFARPSPFTE